MATGLVARFRLAFTPGSQQQLEQEAKQAGKRTATAYESGASGLQTFFSKIGGWLAAAFAVHKVVDFAQASIKAAQESETAWNELGFSLGKVGVRLDDVRGSLEKLGQRFLDKTTFGDEAALRGLNSLVQITGDYTLSLNAVQVAADLAAAKHLSLEDASVLVGRALEGNTIMLKRMGVELKVGQGTLEQLRNQFGGAAENELKTFAGRVKQLSEFWNELKEAIGEALIEAGSGVSVMDTLVGAIKGATTWVKDNKEQFVALGHAIGDVADFLLKQFLPAIAQVGPSWRVAFSPIEAEIHDFTASLLEMRAGFNDGILGNKQIAEQSKISAAHFRDLAKAAREAGVAAKAAMDSISNAAGGGNKLGGAPAGTGTSNFVGGGTTGTAGGRGGNLPDRIVGDETQRAKALAEFKAWMKDLTAEYEAAIRDANVVTLGLTAELDADFKAKSTARLLEIRTEAAAKKAALDDIALRVLEIAGQEAKDNEQARDDEKIRDGERHQHFVEQMNDVAGLAFNISDLSSQILDAGDAWGIFGGKAGKEFAGILDGISKVASGVGNLAVAIGSGDPFAIIGAGLGLVKTVGGFFHENKDAGRTAANAQWYAAAMAGDEGALQELLDHSDPASGKGWATKLARDDAAAKYHGAKVHFDQEAAQAAARGAAAPTTSPISAITPEQILRDQADQAREKERQIRANEEEGIRLRDLAEQQAAQTKLSQDAKGLSDELQRMVAAAIRAQQQAELLGETGPLGFDSPLFRDAETRANRAFDEAQRAVAEALGKQAEASAPGAGVEAGFTVQRTLTEVSAGRIVGELTSQTIWLEKIYNAVSGRTVWPLPGMNGGAGNIVLNLDGQEVARVVGAHQAGDYQLHASLAGSSNLPSV